MKLSILDQAPIAVGKNARDALLETIELAKLGDGLGYTRYWLAEHHDLEGLACPAPELMLSRIGNETEQIRIGSGAILLPHYKPYKVAEVFNMLATLYPGRVDLGIGRSPGGSAEASIALSGNFLENVQKVPVLLDELHHFLYRDFEADHMFEKLNAAPVPETPAETWLLGTSEKSAILAAEKGMNYVFGHFMSDQNIGEILSTYRGIWKEKQENKDAKVFIGINAYCAETEEEAEKLALDSFKWGKRRKEPKQDSSHLPAPLSEEEETEYQSARKKMFIGTPSKIKEGLLDFAEELGVDEFMILTNTPTYAARRNSYQLLAKEIIQ